MKLLSWDGKNKARVRFNKIHEASMLKCITQDNHLSILSFAGSNATFERLLCEKGLTIPEYITTIQTYEKLSSNHNGRIVLDNLIKVRRKFLNGMRIWPYNFTSFSECYSDWRCSYPPTRGDWAKTPYKKFMADIVEDYPKKFDLVDLDMCGIFSRKNGEAIVNLFKNRVFSDLSKLFITHQKGRDVRGGKLFDVLLEALKDNEYIDFSSMEKDFEEDPTNISRYRLIPAYYICKAFDNGYLLTLTKLIEYRDSNKDSGLAVNMLQYFFDVIAKKKSSIDVGDFRKNSLEQVLNEEYTYITWID